MSKLPRYYVPHLTPYFWAESGLSPDDYDVFVETGSYRGFSIDYFKDIYSEIHSIELASRWHVFCKEKFANYPHIHLHHGSSVDLLPKVLEHIRKPAIVFLDAHYSGGSTEKATSDCDSCLLQELAHLKNRDYDDIIIIDDTSFIGQSGGEEPEKIDPEMPDIWPQFAYDWTKISRDAVLSLMKPGYRAVENKGSLYTITPREDQFIFYPDKSQ